MNERTTKETYREVRHEVGKDVLKAMFTFFIVLPAILGALIYFFLMH
jgi:hypothetical protein